jgi:hypothetical protein
METGCQLMQWYMDFISLESQYTKLTRKLRLDFGVKAVVHLSILLVELVPALPALAQHSQHRARQLATPQHQEHSLLHLRLAAHHHLRDHQVRVNSPSAKHHIQVALLQQIQVQRWHHQTPQIPGHLPQIRQGRLQALNLPLRLKAVLQPSLHLQTQPMSLHLQLRRKLQAPLKTKLHPELRSSTRNRSIFTDDVNVGG